MSDNWNESKKKRLFQLILELSFRKGHFVLTSGKTSNYYIDCRKTTLHPEGATLIGEAVFAIGRNHSPDIVGGMTLGADPIATAASMVSFREGSPWRAFIVRKQKKEHGTKQAIEGPIKEGDRALLVEDVITTGGSTIQAIEACRASGLNVVGVFVIVDRQEGGRSIIEETGVPVFTLFTRDDLMAAD